MKVQAKELLPALELINQVPKRSGVECSTIFRVSADKRLRFSLAAELAGVATCAYEGDAESWTLYLEREPLSVFLKSCSPKDELTFTQTKDTLEIKVGRRRLTLTSSGEVTGYPASITPPKGTEVKIPAELRGYMEVACNYAEDTPLSPELACVYLDAGKGLAASYRKTSILWVDYPQVQETMVVNPTLVPLLKGASLSHSESASTLVYAEGWLSKLASGTPAEFPIAVVHSKREEMDKTPVAMSCSAQKALAVLTRLGSYMRTSALAEPLVNVQAVPAKKGEALPTKAVKLTLSAGSAQFSETLTVTQVPDNPFELNLARLLPLLPHIEGSDTLHFHVDPSVVYVRSDKSPYKLLMGRQGT